MRHNHTMLSHNLAAGSGARPEDVAPHLKVRDFASG
jgi:hypothetical protein